MASGDLRAFVFEKLDRQSGRTVLCALGSVFMTATRRQLCRVKYENGEWLHVYRNGTIPRWRIGGTSTRIRINDTEDIFLHDYRPEPGDVVLEVGAGVGEETMPLSEFVGPSGTVVSIEAHPRTFHWLKRLCEVNSLSNVRLHQLAVTSGPGDVLITDDAYTLGNTIVGTASGAVRVPADTLDNIVEREGLTRVDLLKMNIEGAERPAMVGMERTLSMTRHVCISCHDFMAEAGASEEMRTKAFVKAFIEVRGFRVMTRPNDPRPWVRDYLYGRNTKL